MYPPEFFVLHFEFDLMHPQFMNKGGCFSRARITRPVGLGFQAFLGSLSEIPNLSCLLLLFIIRTSR